MKKSLEMKSSQSSRALTLLVMFVTLLFAGCKKDEPKPSSGGILLKINGDARHPKATSSTLRSRDPKYTVSTMSREINFIEKKKGGDLVTKRVGVLFELSINDPDQEYLRNIGGFRGSTAINLKAYVYKTDFSGGGTIETVHDVTLKSNEHEGKCVLRISIDKPASSSSSAAQAAKDVAMATYEAKVKEAEEDFEVAKKAVYRNGRDGDEKDGVTVRDRERLEDARKTLVKATEDHNKANAAYEADRVDGHTKSIIVGIAESNQKISVTQEGSQYKLEFSGLTFKGIGKNENETFTASGTIHTPYLVKEPKTDSED